jgi:alpha-galactosidase
VRRLTSYPRDRRPWAAVVVSAGLAGCDRPACDVEVRTDGIDVGRCLDATLALSVRGEGVTATLVEDDGGVAPIVTAGPEGGVVTAVVLDGPLVIPGEGPLRLWRQGYQSWWWSGVTDLEPVVFDDAGLPVVGGDADGLAATDETAFTSWWVGLLGRPGSTSFLVGATSAVKAKVWTAFADDHAWVVWGHRGETITLEPGESVTLDPIVVQIGDDPFALHRAYAEQAAAHVGVAPRTDRPPTGWGSWNQYYADVTEADVRTELAALPAGADVLLIDDGWEVTWGDWTANGRFPSGMAALAADVREAGHTPGLWMAPFYVDRDTDVAQSHPDWFVRDVDGNPVTFDNFGPHTYQVLDVTHPDAAAWLRDDVVAERVDDGFTFLKLDFLYAGAIEGQRYEPVTGAEAYARGVELLRDGAGPDVFLLACGAPMLPSLGVFDGYRTGADIAFAFDPDPRRDYLRWQARATAARSWQNGVWWWNDPDVVLMRAPFDDVEATGALVANAVSGGLWLLGDSFGALPAGRVGLALDLAETRGASVSPTDPLAFVSGIDFGPIGERGDPDDVAPTTWTFSTGETALLNLGDAALLVDGPGGIELLSGVTAGPGPRPLQPGQGEIWRPE